ncbi:MAG: hypothetical protein Q4G67_13205, partial [Actinomycetia bacterium]|nr:hypothetical protein [Actinomycetes bacterium]
MGTGIVFVVLVAIWAAYFIQYWSRRREHLATARSVEAFSEAMRVLERRPAPRATDTGRISSAYAISPARVVRAEAAPRPSVIAKPHAPRGAVTMSSMPEPSVPGAAPMGGSAAGAAGAPRRAPRKAPRRAPRPVARAGAMRPSRKVRGLTLLATLLLTLVTGVLAAFSLVTWWSPLAALVALVASFFWLRAGVQGEIAARRRAGTRRRAGAARAGARAGAGGAGAAAGSATRAAARATDSGASYDGADPLG